MIDLAAALTVPLAKLFLKTALGEVPVDIGDNLLQLGFTRLGDRAKARQAKALTERVAAGVVADLERFFAAERVDHDLLEVAAEDLAATIGNHVGAAFLVDRQLDAAAIENGLLAARPLDEIYPKSDPAREPYTRLVKALAPRLREIATQLPHYEVERDAEFFVRLSRLADGIGQILAAVAGLKPTIDKTAAGVEELVDRPRQLAEATRPTTSPRSAPSSIGSRSSASRSTPRPAAASSRSPTCRCAPASASATRPARPTSRP
jgi:hypothetical protein